MIAPRHAAEQPHTAPAIPVQYIVQTLDRLALRQSLEDTRLEKETERLRSALLSSVSHDLKSPLASMMGAASSLLQYRARLSDADQQELLDSIVEEAGRLSRYIENLLDMTRLRQGKFIPQKDWATLADIASSATERLSHLLRDHRVILDLPEQLPLLYVNASLIEQALVNMLENAARFSPPGSVITLTARAAQSIIEITLCDQGTGIPVAERERVFDLFYRLEKGDRHQGAGLGLAISKAIITAHEGTISVQPSQQGTCIQLTLPIRQLPLSSDTGIS